MKKKKLTMMILMLLVSSCSIGENKGSASNCNATSLKPTTISIPASDFNSQDISVTPMDDNQLKYEIKDNKYCKVIGLEEDLTKESVDEIVVPDKKMINGKVYIVNEIVSEAFSGCTSLEKITLPFVGGSKDNNTYLGYIFGASYYTKNLDYVPSSLKEVVILEGCTSIGGYAFYDCTSLTSIILPSSLITIDSEAFSGCTSLEKITLPFVGGSKDNNTYLGYIFGASYYTKNLDYVPSSLKEVVILEGCTTIGDCAFENCTSLTSIIIPSSVTTIGGSAFYGCVSLTIITIPSSVTTIGGAAFFRCISLTIYCEASSKPGEWNNYWNRGIPVYWGITSNNKVEIDGIIYVIENNEAIVTRYVDNETSVTIPTSITFNGKTYSVTKIGDRAFSWCTSLTSITIPSSVTKIGGYAFYYCTSLTSITIPSSVTTIGEEAFSGCASLTIYCEVDSEPDGWDNFWNSGRPVIWNY